MGFTMSVCTVSFLAITSSIFSTFLTGRHPSSRQIKADITKTICFMHTNFYRYGQTRHRPVRLLKSECFPATPPLPLPGKWSVQSCRHGLSRETPAKDLQVLFFIFTFFLLALSKVDEDINRATEKLEIEKKPEKNRTCTDCMIF